MTHTRDNVLDLDERYSGNRISVQVPQKNIGVQEISKKSVASDNDNPNLINIQDVVDRNIDAHVLFKEEVDPLHAAPVKLPAEPQLPRRVDMEKLRRWQQKIARKRAQELKRTAFDSFIYFIEREKKEFQKRQMNYFSRSRSA